MVRVRGTPTDGTALVPLIVYLVQLFLLFLPTKFVPFVRLRALLFIHEKKSCTYSRQTVFTDLTVLIHIGV
mgnify:CR=1 FL=1